MISGPLGKWIESDTDFIVAEMQLKYMKCV